jgi:hypothetical protein
MSENITSNQGENMPRPKGSGNRSELVQLALAGIEAQIQQLQSQIDALADKRKQIAKTGGSSQTASASVVSKGRKAAATATGTSSKKKRVVSAATRKKLKEAAKARWAKARGESA